MISCEGATSEIHLQFSISKTNGFFEIVDATGAIYPTIGTVIVGGPASLLNEQMTDYFANYGLSALCDFLDDDHTITCNIVIKNVSAGNKQLIVNTDGTLLRVLTDFDSTPAVTVSGSTLRCCLAPAVACQPQTSVWSNNIYFADVNLPNSAGYICVMPDGEIVNFTVNLSSVTTIEGFIQQIISELALCGNLGYDLEYRISSNDSNACQIRYVGLSDGGNPYLQQFMGVVPQKWETALRDNRNEPWAQGTASETLLNLVNFFTDIPAFGYCAIQSEAGF